MSNAALRESIADGRLFVIRLSMLDEFNKRPDEWKVDPTIKEDLATLGYAMPVLITTSKPVPEAREKLKLHHTHYLGLSGGEVWPAHELLPELDDRIQTAVSEIMKLVGRFKRSLEDAGANAEPHGVLHFSDSHGREDPDAREAVERVRVEAERLGLHVSHDDVGHTVKIRPADPETAVERLLTTFPVDRVTFAGFDEWDVAVAEALKTAREAGRLTQLCVVGALYTGHSMPMQGRADVYVKDIDGVGRLIARLASAVTPPQYGVSGSHLV